jgi:hypothetical protein
MVGASSPRFGAAHGRANQSPRRPLPRRAVGGQLTGRDDGLPVRGHVAAQRRVVAPAGEPLEVESCRSAADCDLRRGGIAASKAVGGPGTTLLRLRDPTQAEPAARRHDGPLQRTRRADDLGHVPSLDVGRARRQVRGLERAPATKDAALGEATRITQREHRGFARRRGGKEHGPGNLCGADGYRRGTRRRRRASLDSRPAHTRTACRELGKGDRSQDEEQSTPSGVGRHGPVDPEDTLQTLPVRRAATGLRAAHPIGHRKNGLS